MLQKSLNSCKKGSILYAIEHKECFFYFLNIINLRQISNFVVEKKNNY